MKKTPWRGIEPRSSAWQAEILATILPRNLFFMEFLLYFKDIHPRTKIIVKTLSSLSFLYSLQMTIDNTIADQLEEASFSFKGDVIQFFKNMIVCSFFAPLSVSTPDLRWILIDIIVWIETMQ